MVKLIVTDLDGTLLNDDKHIPDDNIIALREAMEKGVHVSIATGRNFGSAKRYIKELGLDVPVIFQNGAFIYQWMEDKVIYKSDLKSEIAKLIVEKAREKGLFYVVYIDFLEEKDMYIDANYSGEFLSYLKQNEWRINYVSDVVNYISNRDSIAEVALVGDEEKIKNIVEDDLFIFGESVSVVKNNRINSEVFYEFFGPNSSKDISFNYLLKYFNVKPEETMYLGDNYNDIGMLKIVGYPVVMENAPDEVKKYAKYVSKSNNEAGVAYAVRKLVLGY
ncbi:Cof-type HAD-IIB family hydrolase [Fervidobacterium nodosum]|uniref:Cof-like hydrolase n=1 Tax=Fervidobacterium nodosum (strain ATCC 35602 / DSM 5306 / Rt17-B1) TaxID=381764 RepID=A7HN11_FERNB|nr:Cof-type HAD-IIB family hydrolase [Fervidobacterium nodosum]ABS61294.1 Cof-like hydrolase [Fervidobacterium nodosum Rt17-B1]PHJ14388.1 hydrolase Cof [Fervidobacterium sp. SC_NGM5_G05]